MSVIPVDVSHGLPDGWTPLEMVTAVKCLDEDGEVAMCVRKSEGLTAWEALGMLESGVEEAKEAVRKSTRSPEDSEDD